MDNTTQPPVQPIAPKQANPATEAISKFKSTFKTFTDKLPEPVKAAFAKFYANKMIFWPITISFSLMFLIIILGLLFGTKGTPQPVVIAKKTPVPVKIQPTPEASPSGDILSVTEVKLNDLNTQINNLDPRQSRLQPPSIDFKINF